MKKILLSLFVTGAAMLQSFGQNTNSPAVDSKEYEQMKLNGKLSAAFSDPNMSTFTPSLKDLEKLGPTHKMPAAGGCSCYIAPDPSYTLAMAPNDDGSSGLIAIPFTFCLYGTNYSSLYINNNGNISFGTTYSTFSSSPFPSSSYVMVAPFWGDVDTRGTGQVLYKITPTAMYINWVAVGYYSMMTDKVNTFQLIITDGTDPILPAGNNIAFCYGDMQWTTGAASSGVGGFGGVPATVGINKGDGINYIQMGRFDQPGVAYDGGYGANDGVSWLDYQSLYFNSCSSTNIAPIASGINNCDTVRICGTGDTLLIDALFLSPEIGQNTNITVNTYGLPGATVLSNTPGNSAEALLQIIADPSNAGTHLITFTATDDGAPVGTTVINTYVYIDTVGLSGFNPVISGATTFCAGGSSTLSVSPTTYDTYVWNTGSNTTSTTVDSTGDYYVTSTLNGCSKTNMIHVTEYPYPTPLILGSHTLCAAATDTLASDSLIYASYLWSPGGSTNDSVFVGPGSYTLTVTDNHGCSATTPAFLVSGPPSPVITGVSAVCNGSLTSLTTTTPYVSYDWSTGSTNDSITVGGGSYTVNVIDTNGCNLTSAPFPVSVFNFSLSLTGVSNYCTGSSITLTAAGTPSTGATYSWLPSGTGPTHVVSAGGSYTVTLLYPNGCTTDTTVTVPGPWPVPTPVIVGNTVSCNTTPVWISVDSAGLYTAFVWTPASGSNDSVSTLAGSYSVTVTDVHGCQGTSPGFNVTNFDPHVSITGDTAFCPGSTGSLTAVPTIPAGASYLWSNSATTATQTVGTTGNYSVVVSYANGCTATDNFNVSQYPAPNASFTMTPPSPVAPGIPISFVSNSTISSGSIMNYYWNFGDTSSIYIVQAITPSTVHTYDADGVYPVTLGVESNYGCRDTITINYEILSDISTPNVITPNGDGHNDVLSFKNLDHFPGTTLTIYNRWGNKIYSSPNYQNDWGGESHSDGVYYYVLEGPKLKSVRYGFVQVLNN